MALSVKNMLGGSVGNDKEYKLNVETTYVNTFNSSILARYYDSFEKSDNGYFFAPYINSLYVYDANFNQVHTKTFISYTGSASFDSGIKRVGENKYFMASSHNNSGTYYTAFTVFIINDDGTIDLSTNIITSSYRPYHAMQVSDSRIYVYTYHSSGYSQMYTVDIGEGTTYTYIGQTMSGQSMSTVYTKELNNNVVFIYGSSGLCYFLKYTDDGFTNLYNGWLHDSTQTSAFSNFEVVEYNGDIHVIGIASNGVAYPTYDVKYSLNDNVMTREQVILAQSYSVQGKNIYFNDGLHNIVPHIFINTEDPNHIYAYGWTETNSNPFYETDIKTIGSQSMRLELRVNANGFFEVVDSEYIPIVMLENYIKHKVYNFMGKTYLTAYISGNSTFGVDASTLPTYKIDEEGKPKGIIFPHNKIWGYSNGQVYPNTLSTYRMGNMIFMSTGHSGNYGRPYMCHVLMGDGEKVAIESVLEGVNSSMSLVYHAIGNKSYLSTLENEFYIIERDNTREVYRVNVEIVEV